MLFRSAKGIDTIKLACFTLDRMIRSEKSQAEIHDFLVSQSTAVQNTTMESSTGVYGYIYGEYLDGTDWVPDADYIPTERPWYIDAMANVGRVAVVDPYVDAETNTLMITFSKTLCDAESVAAMDFSIDPLQTIAEEVAAQGGGIKEIVLDRKYQVIAHSDKSEIGKSYLTEKGSFGSALVNQLRVSDESYFSLRYEGADYIVYRVSVSNDWLCLSVSDTTSVFSQLRQTLLFTIAVSLAVVLILLLIMSRFNRKQMELIRLSVHTEELNKEVAKQTAVAEERSRKIEQMSFQTMQALAHAIDAKDPYTRGHSTRVSQYSVLMAEALGWDKERVSDLRYAALLHDIGKIGVPDSILNNPRRLTDVEYGIIKSHTTMGGDILRNRIMIEKAEEVARSHHERYDGMGYPRGLKGEEILIEARIVAIADAFDAMSSNRVYRKACDRDHIRHELEAGKGKQFDPELVDVFIGLWDQGLLDPIMESEPGEEQEDAEASSVLLQEVVEAFVSQSAADDIDVTTGIMSRTAGETVIAKTMQEAGGCFVFFDVDNLKKINDTNGHEAGDRVLRLMGATLTENSERTLCCRLGGDEFLVFMKEASREEAEARVRKIIREFEEKKNEDVGIAIASLSVGMVMCPAGEPYAKAYSKADKALYHVKQGGKNGFCFYEEDADSAESEPVNVNKLVNGIRNSGSYNGALDVEYRQFAKFYEYIFNLERRFSHQFELILISLDTAEGMPPQTEELEKGMFYMEQSIRQTIRNVDVLTRYGRHQFLIIMIGTDPEGAKIAVDRIFRGYYKMNGSSAYTPSYFIAEMDGSA